MRHIHGYLWSMSTMQHWHSRAMPRYSNMCGCGLRRLSTCPINWRVSRLQISGCCQGLYTSHVWISDDTGWWSIFPAESLLSREPCLSFCETMSAWKGFDLNDWLNEYSLHEVSSRGSLNIELDKCLFIHIMRQSRRFRNQVKLGAYALISISSGLTIIRDSINPPHLRQALSDLAVGQLVAKKVVSLFRFWGSITNIQIYGTVTNTQR